jgi:hypothetical protein
MRAKGLGTAFYEILFILESLPSPTAPMAGMLKVNGGMCSHLVLNPNSERLAAVGRVMQYLYGTRHLGTKCSLQ